jgi:hypothetical protein
MPLATAAPRLLSFSPQLDLRYVTTDGQDPPPSNKPAAKPAPLRITSAMALAQAEAMNAGSPAKPFSSSLGRRHKGG